MRAAATMAAWTMAASTALAADWYVDAAASGSNDGTSWTDAWQTTGAIDWTDPQPGDTVWIQGGAYGALLIPSAATVTGVTVRIAADATEQAVFSGDQASAFSDIDGCLIDGLLGTNYMLRFKGQTNAAASEISCISLKYSQSVTLRGLEVEREAMFALDGDAAKGINVANSSAPANDLVVIEDCYLHGLTGDAINIGTPGPSDGYDRYIVRRCVIRKTGDDGLQASGNVTLEGCTIDHADGGSLFGGHPDGIQTAIGARYVRIARNRITGYTQNIFVEEATGHVEIVSNLLYGDGATNSSARGIVAGVLSTNSFEGNFVVAHNTIYGFWTYYGAQHGSLRYLAANTTGQVHFGNNLYIDCRYAVAGDALLGADNMWWDSPGVQFYDTSGNPVDPAGDRSVGSATNSNPLVVSLSDFRLQSGSPAIDAGSDFTTWAATDLLGTSVPRGNAPDIGAYEFGALRTAPDDPPLRLWLGVPQ